MTKHLSRDLEHVKIPIRRRLNGRVWTTTEALWLWSSRAREISDQIREGRARAVGRPPGAVLH